MGLEFHTKSKQNENGSEYGIDRKTRGDPLECEIRPSGKIQECATPNPNVNKIVGSQGLNFLIPIQTVSESNRSSEHWSIKHKRHALQRRAVAAFLKPHKSKVILPCAVKLTRYAPRSLDALDNLPMSLKWITDAVCAIITGDFRPGRADSDPRISLSVDQVKSSTYGVRIEITW